jgi:hypothetical protein
VDVWVAAGLILGAIGIAVSTHYGRRSIQSSPRSPRVIVTTSNVMPLYDLPAGRREPGDHHVSVEAVNTGDRSITITGWGVKLPEGRHIVVTHPPNWATPLPHELRPGAAPARFLMLAEDLRRLERENGISYGDMRPYVTLADGTEVLADRRVPLA